MWVVVQFCRSNEGKYCITNERQHIWHASRILLGLAMLIVSCFVNGIRKMVHLATETLWWARPLYEAHIWHGSCILLWSALSIASCFVNRIIKMVSLRLCKEMEKDVLLSCHAWRILFTCSLACFWSFTTFNVTKIVCTQQPSHNLLFSLVSVLFQNHVTFYFTAF